MQASGFSLLELLIALLIMSLMTSIGINYWDEIKLRSQLAQTTKRLAYYLNEVQLDAYLNNRTLHVYIFTAPFCLAASQSETLSKCQGTFQFDSPNNSVSIQALTENKRISFWGQRNMAQTASILLKNKIASTKIIISYRGRIRMCSLNTPLLGIPTC